MCVPVYVHVSVCMCNMSTHACTNIIIMALSILLSSDLHINIGTPEIPTVRRIVTIIFAISTNFKIKVVEYLCALCIYSYSGNTKLISLLVSIIQRLLENYILA